MRILLLHHLARLLRLRFLIDGIPYGAKTAINDPGDCSPAIR